MTIDELKILLDIDSPGNVIKSHAKKYDNGWLFVDSSDGHCYLFDKNGKEKDIHGLTKIDDSLFYNDSTLTKIVVPNSVTSIGGSAFEGCKGLTSVTIGNGVTSIGYYAFLGCDKLTSVTIPERVMNIGSCAFSNCSNLKSFVFKGKTLEEVKAMNNYPFGIEDKSVIKCKTQS